MATFGEMVTAYSGSYNSSELATWLSDATIDIIRRMRIINVAILPRFSQGTYLTSGSCKDCDGFIDITDVSRNGYEAREISSTLRHRASRSTSLYRATDYYPVFYKLSNELCVLPTPTDSESAYISYIGPYTVSATDESINNFPDELEYLVVLYASSRNILSQINDKSIPNDPSLPVPPTIASFSSVSESLPVFSSVPIAVIPDPPDDADIDFSGIGDTPSFTEPDQMVLPVWYEEPDLSISNLTINSVAPIGPDISIDDGEIDSFENSPTYTKPVVSLTTSPTISDVDIDSIAPPIPPASPDFTSINISDGTPPIYTKPSPPEALATIMGDIDTHLDTNEDVELAQTKIAQMNSDIEGYMSDIQNELNAFNQKLAIYQNETQVNIEEASLAERKEVEEYAAKLNRYQAEVQAYGAKVNASVNQFVNNTRKDVDIWKSQIASEIQKYQADIQNELNEFNKELSIYKASIQKNIQEASNQITSDTSEIRAELENYAAEINKYQIQINYEIQEYVQTVNSEVTEWVQKRRDRIQEFQIDSNNAIQFYNSELKEAAESFNADLQKWSALINKALQEYQSETGYDLGRYSSEVQAILEKYAADINNRVSEFSADAEKYQLDLAKISEENERVLYKYMNQGQIYSSEVQANIGEFNAKLNKFQVDLSRLTALYNSLMNDYERGFIMYQTGGDQ